MNPFASLVGREEKVADFSALSWSSLLGAPISKTGASVNLLTALRVSTVLACVRVLAEGVAMLPLKLYRERKSGTKDIADDHPVHRVIAHQPNSWMTSFEWRETSMFHSALSRGAHALILRVGGQVDELIPLQPGAVTPLWSNGVLRYRVSDRSGVVGEFPRSEILAVRGPSWTGYQALELIQQAAEAIGLSIAIEETQARLHANGARPSGILSTDNPLTEAARARLAGLFADGFQGLMNAGKVPILDNGLKFQSALMTGVDAQTLESRKHQIEEIARMLRVHPQMIGHGDKAPTYASAEQFFTAHAVHSLGPWVERWQQALSRDLLTREEVRDGYIVRFNMQALMRGDSSSQAAFFKAALGTASSPGWMSPNDVRRLLDMNPGDDDLDAVMSAMDMAGKVDPVTGAHVEDPAAGPPVDPAVAAGAAVQDTALNGAQVASLLAIVQAVAAGQLPADTARAMILASFPGVPQATIDAMLAGLDDFTPPAPPPAKVFPPPDAGVKAFGGSLERAFASLAVGLSSRGEPEVEFIRDASGQVTGAKPIKRK